MRRHRQLAVTVIVVFLFSAPPLLLAQQEDQPTDYRTVTIENFADPEASPWSARASRFIDEGRFRYNYFPEGPDALYRRTPEEERSSFGINAGFLRPGYNYIEVFPVEETANGEIQPRGVTLPGRAEEIDLWIWGSNHDFYVDLHLRDHRGIIHRLHVGDLDYNGWRNHRVRIPPAIPQTSPTLPRVRELELVKLVVWTRPLADVSNFFVYFDEIRVFTNLYEPWFDGEQLGDPQYYEELWDRQDPPPTQGQ